VFASFFLRDQGPGGPLLVGLAVAVPDDHLRAWKGTRDSSGDITVDPVQWPGGMRAIVDHIHGKGLKAGTYTDAGRDGCGYYYPSGHPAYPGTGSEGHYDQPALVAVRCTGCRAGRSTRFSQGKECGRAAERRLRRSAEIRLEAGAAEHGIGNLRRRGRVVGRHGTPIVVDGEHRPVRKRVPTGPPTPGS
jgi:Alpha galactosidase A